MYKRFIHTVATVSIFMMTLVAVQSNALAGDKPFAEHKIVLQISDDDPKKQTLVLNVANNLLKEYGQDKVDIEVVAFGPGLNLLFANNKNKGRVDDLAKAADVRFTACSNTIKAVTKKLGHPPVINPIASTQYPGIVRIVDLTGKGYTLVRP